MNDSFEYDVIVYGTVCIDAIWRVDRLAAPGGYEPIREERILPGGEAINTAIALNRWGLRVVLVGNALGEDADGRLFRELLAQAAPGLDSSRLTWSAAIPTPRCICIATPDGHRTMYGSRFADLQPPPLDPDLVRKARWFTAEPNARQAGILACETAATQGAKVLAMDYTREERVNRIAALNVTSYEYVGVDKPLEELGRYAAQLRDSFGGTTIVTCGERGCFLAARGKQGATAERFPAYIAPVIEDTTGAGDIFRAGLLFGQIHDWDMGQSIRFAAAAAALNCGALGGWGGVQSVEVIQTFQQTARRHAAGD